MRTTFSFVLFCFCMIANASAQTLSIKGIVKDNEGKILPNASVLLFYENETDTLKTVSNEKGIFNFNETKSAKTGIIVTYSGYNPYAQYYDFASATGQQFIQDIALVPGGLTLENITVQAPRIQIKEDTISYRIDSTMYRKNDNVEQVLKKLPGVEVDKEGKVTAQGEEVTKVKVNGKDFFGGDVTTATRNLNADMVDRIDIIDDYGDQAAFTGVKDGTSTKTLNIQLKKDKNKGYFGNASLGVGTEDRYANSVTLNRFNNEQQISLIGNLNNTNASSFNFGSMGRMGGGMVRSFRSMGGFGGGGNGVATTKSIGLNYRDKWSEKISVNGSYSYTDRSVLTQRDQTRQNIFSDGTVVNTDHSNDETNSENHRFTFNMEYNIDKYNYLKFSPTVSYAKTHTEYVSIFDFLGKTGEPVNDGISTELSKNNTLNFSGNLLYNHRFDAKGRILSLNLTGNTTGTDGDEIANNLTTYYNLTGGTVDSALNQYILQDNSNNNYGINVSYIEPLNKKQHFNFNYAYNRRYTDNNRENYIVDPQNGKTMVDSLSNIYDNLYITNRFGVNFVTNEKKYTYTLGLAVQPGSIESDNKTSGMAYKQNLLNFYPVMRLTYNFSRSRSLSLNYQGSTSQPSYSQLQPVYDFTNPQYITLGNPDLKPEFNNQLGLRYNNFDFITGNIFFGNINLSYVKDKIVDNVFNRGAGVQETQYLNDDGYYTASAFYAFSKPIQNRKFVFNYGGSAMYNHNISYLDNAKNKGKNLILGQRFSTTITLEKWLETNVGLNYTYNETKYSLREQLNSTVHNWSLSHYSRIDLPKNFIINYDLNKTFNDGYSSNVDANPFIINASIEKEISKKHNASLRLNAYDLLDENTNVSRIVTGSAITDSRTNQLGRYFMLSLVFRFNKFTAGGSGSAGGPPPHMMR